MGLRASSQLCSCTAGCGAVSLHSAPAPLRAALRVHAPQGWDLFPREALSPVPGNGAAPPGSPAVGGIGRRGINPPSQGRAQ